MGPRLSERGKGLDPGASGAPARETGFNDGGAEGGAMAGGGVLWEGGPPPLGLAQPSPVYRGEAGICERGRAHPAIPPPSLALPGPQGKLRLHGSL